MNARESLQVAVRGLLDVASDWPPLFATAINLACIGLGIAVWHLGSFPVDWGGALFAAISAWGIVKWMLASAGVEVVR